MNKLLSIFNFNKTLKNTDVPIIEVISNGHKGNFLIDSGSSESYIDKRYIKDFDVIPTGNTIERTISHAGGTAKDETPLYHFLFKNSDGKEFYEEVQVYDFSETFKVFLDESNLIVHGILGTSFLKRYNCVVDFNNNIIRNVRNIEIKRK